MKKKIISLYLQILRFLAKAQLIKNKPLIIGITGSAGKSSCTHLVGTVLSKHFSVKYTKKGNSETGIPFELLNIPVKNYSGLGWLQVIFQGIYQVLFNWETYSILVVEMGIDSNQPPKNMTTLLQIVSPDIGVFLNVNNVHLAYFTGPKETQTIANEKAKLLFDVPANGLAITTADQKEIQKIIASKKVKANLQTFGINKKADIRLIDHKVDLEKTIFTFSYKEKLYTLTLRGKLVFKEAFGSFATTFLITQFLGVTPTKAIQTIENSFTVLPGRGRLFKGLNDSIIIDSSYNSSLAPTSAALQLLASLKHTKNRTIAILGDMRELGEKAEADHKALEKVALQSADVIYTVGPLTTDYFTDKRIRKYLNPYSALTDIQKEIQKNDLILVKGSQNTILLESIVEALLKDPKDIKQLCRQSDYWKTQRKKLKKEAI